ncbi:MAG: hypothetical protein HOU81_12715 [Hamadaea sp.]|uniref:hypothetical protein n=1 Tax=Hamadaea sp. TaxID=2024425 RepID=UPI001803676F|nr:hypothetical protein [Hamadaea sp.]NUR71676.1 hypothetical protein [Hamadaea sp.]NUT18168.1 hypothetical protein [Hamadaea sp.]
MTKELPAELARAIDKRSPELAYAYLMTLSEKERKAAFPAAVAYTREELSDWRGGYEAVAGLVFLGCAPTAKRAMPALNRGGLRWRRGSIPRQLALDLLAARDLPWLGELASLWSTRSDLSNVAEWQLVDGIAGLAGIEPPVTAGFTRGWIAWVRAQPDPAEAITTGPYAALLPMLFEDDTMGRELEFTFHGKGFNTALLRLAEDDPEVRAMLVDGCLARLLRGGRPGDLRPFVALHDELKVTPAEIGARTADYLGLADATLGTVAGLAQRSLRHAHEAGLLETDTLLELTAIILRRKEKGLIKTQITWVRTAAKRHPDRRTELLASLDLPAEPDLLPSAPLIALPVPEMPPPLASPAEIAEELTAILGGDRSIVSLERVLAAIVEQYTRDHRALADAVSPLLTDRHRLGHERARGYWAALGRMLCDVVRPPESRSMWLKEAFADLRADHALARPLADPERSPSVLLEIRLATIERYLRRSPVPRLVATPTHRNGHLDAEVLLGRLEQAEREGWQPWRIDLDQALLRLPRTDPGDGVRRRAERLASPAGQAFTAVLHNGHADPLVTAYAQEGGGGRYPWYGLLPDRRVAVTMEPPAKANAVEAALFKLRRDKKPQGSPWVPGSTTQIWTGALPSHREVVAAWALPSLAMAAERNTGSETGQILPLLAENHGPTGPATQLALVYGMCAPEATDRVAAVDALLAFGSGVDWRATGRHLGDCAAPGSLVLSRAAGVLRDAAEAGAVETVWAICVGALPALLSTPKPRVGTTDILQLAERCTRTLSRRDHVDGLAEVADRGGGSQFVSAARGLRDALAGLP